MLRRRILLEAAKLFDLAVMVCAFVLAGVLVASQSLASSLAQLLSMQVTVVNFALFTGFLMVWHIVFAAWGLYRSRRLSAHEAEALDVAKATSTASLLLFIGARVLGIGMITPAFILLFWIIGASATLATRFVGRKILEAVRSRGRNLRLMLVVGTNARAVRFAQHLQGRPELGYKLAGFVDDQWFGIGEFHRNGHKLVSDLKSFPAFLRDHVVDEVAIALPMGSAYAEARRIAALCEEQGIIIRLLTDIFELRLARPLATPFEGQEVITLHPGAPENWQHLLKRLLDIMLALLVIVLVAPLGALAALAIKLTSRGPIFFRQEHVGLNKRRFRLIKFRTMVSDAELRLREVEHLNEASGPVFKIRNDPRITPVGTILRKTSIDELPQLFNVLKGDMSLVGPRPLPIRDYAGFREDWQRRRFSVRPGITCLWQVNGRSSISFDKWMELDMHYIDHWSIGLDFKILAKTIPAVLKGAGAT